MPRGWQGAALPEIKAALSERQSLSAHTCGRAAQKAAQVFQDLVSFRLSIFMVSSISLHQLLH
jgi:hypothetical protein